MRRVPASCSKRASSAAWSSRPSSTSYLTRVVASAIRFATAGPSWRPPDGPGGSRPGPQNSRSSRCRGSGRYRAPNPGPHGAAQGRGIPEPGADARPGGRPGENSLEFLLPGGGRGSAAFWFPARPAGTEHILLARHPASHSCTVLSVRSTVSAMMLVLAPSEAYREDDLRAYQQASSDMLQNAAGAVTGWVSENWEYIAAGGMAAAGVAVMCTGIGRPIGAAMMAGALTRRRQHLNPEILQRRRGLGHRPTRRRRRRRHRPDRRRSPPRIS